MRPVWPSALQVAGPTIPSAVRPWLRWKALTARWVPGPKMPSAGMPSARWRSTTAPFLLPPVLETWRVCAEAVMALEALDGPLRGGAEHSVGVEPQPALDLGHVRAMRAALEHCLGWGRAGREQGDGRHAGDNARAGAPAW